MWVKRKGKNGKTVRLYDYTKLRWAVEIEVEYPKRKESEKLIERHRTLKGWEIDYDGSLDNGAEYRPRKANHLYFNEEAKMQVKEVMALIKLHGGKVSRNCGLHIHIDATKMTNKQILTIITEFIHRQRFIVKKFDTSKDRLESMCKLLPFEGLTKIKEKDIAEYRKEGGKWDFEAYDYFSEKYHALNITSLPTKGTLEFRLFNATNRPKEILERVEWVLKFIKDCMERD